MVNVKHHQTIEAYTGSNSDSALLLPCETFMHQAHDINQLNITCHKIDGLPICRPRLIFIGMPWKLQVFTWKRAWKRALKFYKPILHHVFSRVAIVGQTRVLMCFDQDNLHQNVLGSYIDIIIGVILQITITECG
jgi:hypothetical protein